jgi:hypothetical protein
MNGADPNSPSLAEAWPMPEATQNTRCKRVFGHPSTELREVRLFNTWGDSSLDDNNLDYSISNLVRLYKAESARILLPFTITTSVTN